MCRLGAQMAVDSPERREYSGPMIPFQTFSSQAHRLTLPLLLALGGLPACAQKPAGGKAATPATGDTGTTDGDTGHEDTGTDTGTGGGDTGPVCGAITATITTDAIAGELPLTANLAVEVQCADGEAVTPTVVSWDFGDGVVGEEVSLPHTWLASGDFTVTVDLMDEEGESASATIPIRVATAGCPQLDDRTEVGQLQEPELARASGLVEGRRNPGILWTHNDAGDSPRLFAMEIDGTPRGSFTLSGAPDGDWEDLAIGEDPDSGEPLIYVGDIGGSVEPRESLRIYLVPEPEVGTDDVAAELSDYGTLDLTFPEGLLLDSGTLLVDPVTQDLYLLVLEEDGTSGIYRAAAPHEWGSTVEVERITGLRFGEGALHGSNLPVGGEFSPLGDKLIVRTADSAFIWLRDQAVDMDTTWSTNACPAQVPPELRGESICFSLDGAGFYTTSEEIEQPIWYSSFVPADPPCTALEAGIEVEGEDYGAPFDATFSVDERCIPAGVADVIWSFGDDSEPSQEPSASHTFEAPGTYTVLLVLTDGDGATTSASTDIKVSSTHCPTMGTSQQWGAVETEELTEASGLGSSTLNPGVLWSHNDSGNDAVLFAFAEDGTNLGIYALDLPADDWEDLSLGFDSELGADAIYVGDIGDNREDRPEITVLVVPEPAVDTDAAPVSAELSGWNTLTLTYPDGPHNAETLMVDPLTGDLIIVTKDYGGETFVFRKAAPHVDGSNTVLDLVADLTFAQAPLSGSGAATGGDISPDGALIAVRTYSSAYAWRREEGEEVGAAFDSHPCNLGAHNERQGEAITFQTDGSGYIQVSEGDFQPIYFTPVN